MIFHFLPNVRGIEIDKPRFSGAWVDPLVIDGFPERLSR